MMGAQVEGSVLTASGNVTIGADTCVAGAVHVLKRSNGWFPVAVKKKPVVIIGPNATVKGPLLFDQPVILHVDQSARIGEIKGIAPTRVFTFAAK